MSVPAPPDPAPTAVLPPEPKPDLSAEAKQKAVAMGWGFLTWLLAILPFLGRVVVIVTAHAIYFVVAGTVYLFLLGAGFQSADEFFAVKLHQTGIPWLTWTKGFVETKGLTMADFTACLMVMACTVAWEVLIVTADDPKPATVTDMIWRTACLIAVVVEPVMLFYGMRAGGKTIFAAALLTVFVTVVVVISSLVLSRLWKRKETT